MKKGMFCLSHKVHDLTHPLTGSQLLFSNLPKSFKCLVAATVKYERVFLQQ